MGTPPTMSRDSGIRPALHRCPKCVHPMAPGEGVPDTRLGAFGIEANLGEMDFDAFVEGLEREHRTRGQWTVKAGFGK